MCEDGSHPGPQGACSTICRDNLQNIAVCVDEANVGNGHSSSICVDKVQSTNVCQAICIKVGSECVGKVLGPNVGHTTCHMYLVLLHVLIEEILMYVKIIAHMGYNKVCVDKLMYAKIVAHMGTLYVLIRYTMLIYARIVVHMGMLYVLIRYPMMMYAGNAVCADKVEGTIVCQSNTS